MNDNILIRIDFQNDFVHPDGALSICNTHLIAAHQKFVKQLEANSFVQIIETYDTHFAETYSETIEAQNYPPHCLFGSWGWLQAAPFDSAVRVSKLYKSTTNLWNETVQYKLLNTDWRTKNVYLCGLLSDVCVQQAMDGFLKRNAHVIILKDLCQGLQRQINDIIQDDCYLPYRNNGHLRSMTASQFLRQALSYHKDTEQS